MISHVHVGISDFESAFAFYSAVLSVLGLELKFKEAENGWAGWMTPGVARPLFLIGRPFNREPVSPGNGQMIALLAPDRAAVDRCHATALAHGASCEGAPGLRRHYHPNYYGAYFRDPDGNKLCVCCHQPEPGP
jgi:catechol 2,3-dioxygenase-like lactoylglutathione lyase family enzyme